MHKAIPIVLMLNLMPAAVMAQQIDRIKITDNEMTCKQMHADIAEMDIVMAEAKEAEAAGQTTATAGKAGDVAAEVASRTGLFGSLGGLAGHIFGSVASKAAASATEQSGQQSSQQAVERGRQAAARKEHVTSLFLNKGCKSSDLNYEPAASANKPIQVAMAAAGSKPQRPIAEIAQQAAASVTLLPAVDTAEYFDGKNGGTFGAKTVETLPKSKRVAVAGFRVVFINFNRATASVRGVYLPGGVEKGSARSTTEITLSGVDAATMQAIANQGYATFIAQLKASGREIVPDDQMKSFWGQIQPAASPYSKTQDFGATKRTGVAFSPAGIPLWWQSSETWGDTGLFDQTNMRALATFAVEAKAIVVAPVIVVDFAELESSGANNSALTTRAASTGSKLSLAVTEFSSRVVRSEESRQGLVFQGEDGHLALKKRVATDLPFAEMVNSQQSRGGLISLPGIAGSNTVTATSTAQSSPESYTKASVTTLAQATGIFAKLFKDHAAP